jgi:hypothetical protein
MMRSRLDFTLDEADNADNLLLWEQEVFSWADYSEPGACGVPRCQSTESNVLDPRLRGNDRRKAGTGACPYGMWGQLPAQGSCDLCASWASFASPVPPTGVCRGPKPLCRGFGGVPPIPPSPEGGAKRCRILPAGVWGVPRYLLSPPKIGGQGVEYDSLNAM